MKIQVKHVVLVALAASLPPLFRQLDGLSVWSWAVVGHMLANAGTVAVATAVRSWLPAAAGALVVLVAVSAAAAACTPSDAPPPAALAAYSAEQVDCVEEADARAAADRCRAGVRERFCGQYPAACDGGAP